MVRKIENLVLLAILAALLLVVQSSTSSPIQNDDIILEELKAELKSLRVKVDLLEARNVENEATISKQGEKIMKLEEKMDGRKLIESDRLAPALLSTDYNGQRSSNSEDSSTRAMAPSSCRELSLLGHSLDGLYLVQNVETNKIQTVLCNFGTSISQQLVGDVDIKTKTVHFYVQRNSSFSDFDIIPWELERLNEGGAMNLTSGIFTVPVDGIYHFEFSGLKDSSSPYFYVWLLVNGANVGSAGTSTAGANTGNYESYSLTASLRLKAGDRVNMYNYGDNSVLYENGTYKNHFSGWLVEQDLSPVV